MSRVGDYKLYEELGSGAFGTVFKAKKNGKFYAMKRVPLNRSSDVEREMESQEALPRNPSVVSLVDSYFTGDYMYLVLDYCNNGTLNDYIIENRVGDDCLAAFMRDMIKGVKHLHDHDIVHRDIKPDNILLHVKSGKRPICKLSDFGLARYTGSSTSSYYDQSYYLQTDCGTPFFIAPEVLTNHYTEACDVFSLGVVFFAIQAESCETVGGTLIATVDGSTPFYQASYKRIKKRVNSQVSDSDIGDCIKSMLHTNYKDRIDIDELEVNFNYAAP